MSVSSVLSVYVSQVTSDYVSLCWRDGTLSLTKVPEPGAVCSTAEFCFNLTLFGGKMTKRFDFCLGNLTVIKGLIQ